MSRVVLLFPKPGPKDTEYEILPLGILYVAGAVIEAGYEASVLDQRKGPDWRAALRELVTRPDTVCVGISTMTGPQIAHGLEMARIVREAAPETPLVWGGVHPSLLPDQTARHDLVDIVCFGEGETAFPPLVAALEKGDGSWRTLPGVCYQADDGNVVKNAPAGVPDLEQIPPLPYQLFNLDDYKVSALRSAPSLPIVTSRGCSFRCAYCYITEFFNRTWRSLSPPRVIADIKHLTASYGAEGIFLLDDFFFQHKRRAAEILQGMIDEGIEIDLYNANCRADFLYRRDDNYLRLMREAGIKTLFVGVESGSPATLKDMLKDLKTHQVLEINQRLAKVGIKAVYSFMAGMPGESEENVLETLAFMLRLKEENPDAMLYKVNLFVPFPGTEYFRRAKELGCKFPETLEGWSGYDYSSVNLDYLSPRFRRFLEKAESVSAFIDVDGKAGPVITSLARVYSQVARHRVRNRSFAFVPELPLIKAARVFT